MEFLPHNYSHQCITLTARRQKLQTDIRRLSLISETSSLHGLPLIQSRLFPPRQCAKFFAPFTGSNTKKGISPKRELIIWWPRSLTSLLLTSRRPSKPHAIPFKVIRNSWNLFGSFAKPVLQSMLCPISRPQIGTCCQRKPPRKSGHFLTTPLRRKFHSQIQVGGELTQNFLSAAAHERKPNIGFYQHVINATGVDPTRTIFVDDKVENVLTARSFGIHGIVYDNLSNVVQQLRNLCGDPVSRGKRFLESRKQQLTSVTSNGIQLAEVLWKFSYLNNIPSSNNSPPPRTLRSS